MASRNLINFLSSSALKPVPNVFCLTKSRTILYVSNSNATCLSRVEYYLRVSFFFTNFSKGESSLFIVCSQKSGASTLMSLFSSDLNFVFEKVQVDTAYYTFLAFFERISSMDC